MGIDTGIMKFGAFKVDSRDTSMTQVEVIGEKEKMPFKLGHKNS